MQRLCEGRVAIVTGAGRGLGREYALMLAAHGARVLVNDLGSRADGTGKDTSPAQEVVDEIRSAGGEAAVNHDDVSDMEGAHRMVRQAIDAFGGLDVLINNAGILRDRMLVNMTEEEWDSVIKVHMKGTFAPTRHAVDYWREKVKAAGSPVNARIINTTSPSGLYGNVGQTNYAAAKMGICAMTIVESRELQRYGITVNAIAPRAQTRLTEGLRELTPEQIERRHPRFVASIVVWLASAESRAITGRVFEAGNGVLAVAESWRRGPCVEPTADPTAIGPIATALVAAARRNVDMDSQEIG
jgi:NAD(P)-dependent dehydrogenase (short-subunit alcohol dehydrogenase family)